MVKLRTKFGLVPVILAAAVLPGAPVEIVPMVKFGEAPVAPVGPVLPVGPVAPVGPVGPVGPGIIEVAAQLAVAASHI